MWGGFHIVNQQPFHTWASASFRKRPHLVTTEEQCFDPVLEAVLPSGLELVEWDAVDVFGEMPTDGDICNTDCSSLLPAQVLMHESDGLTLDVSTDSVPGPTGRYEMKPLAP